MCGAVGPVSRIQHKTDHPGQASTSQALGSTNDKLTSENPVGEDEGRNVGREHTEHERACRDERPDHRDATTVEHVDED